MSDMVERVAKWLFAVDVESKDYSWEAIGSDQHLRYLRSARAAIAAMREPTAHMWTSAKPYMDSESSNAAWWRAMVDAALEEVRNDPA